jgi:hypothetical protein
MAYVAEEYNGWEAREIDGEFRYGYVENPNAKWDYWQLGGRYSGFLPMKDGTKPVIFQRKDICLDILQKEVDAKIEELFQTYLRVQEELSTGTKLEDIDEVFLFLLELRSLGFDENVTNLDITSLPPLTLEELKTKHRWHYKKSTYAVLDNKGWYERDESDNAVERKESLKKWQDSYIETFIESRDPEDYFFVIDCHI